ncbi:MAG TPA: entericidin A/B family lipoprotein [Candidatus Hydrogenedentes bacterium]|nr:entericidin A/B family lipoprotein [Candidatus Hydrogenedentota bacterium]
MKWLRIAALMLAFMSAFASVSGCNTIRGMGKDIEKGGQAIQDAAK